MAEQEFTTERDEIIKEVERLHDEELCPGFTWEQKVISAAIGEIGVIRGLTDKAEEMLELIMEKYPAPECDSEPAPPEAEKKPHTCLSVKQIDEVDTLVSETRALALALIDGETEEWAHGEVQTLANMIHTKATRLDEILKAGAVNKAA